MRNSIPPEIAAVDRDELQHDHPAGGAVELRAESHFAPGVAATTWAAFGQIRLEGEEHGRGQNKPRHEPVEVFGRGA
jgi:hypothetical protein